MRRHQQPSAMQYDDASAGGPATSYRDFAPTTAARFDDHRSTMHQQAAAAHPYGGAPLQQQQDGAAPNAYAAARSRGRLHRVFVRLNGLEWLLVQLLQFLSLWPALLQPPHTDALLKEIEGNQHALLQADVNASAAANASLAAGTTEFSAVCGRWSTSLLKSASLYVFPTNWQPLSFRKTVLVEPSLEPLPSQASTPTQQKLALAFVFAILAFNSVWLR